MKKRDLKPTWVKPINDLKIFSELKVFVFLKSIINDTFEKSQFEYVDMEVEKLVLKLNNPWLTEWLKYKTDSFPGSNKLVLFVSTSDWT